MNKNLIIELVKESFIGNEADEDGFTQIEYAGKLQDFITFAEKIIDHYETEKAQTAAQSHRQYRGGKYGHLIYKISLGVEFDAEECKPVLNLLS